jgi:hypothetical protein
VTQTTAPARTGSAPYGWPSPRAGSPQASAAPQRRGNDGTGVVVFTESAAISGSSAASLSYAAYQLEGR